MSNSTTDENSAESMPETPQTEEAQGGAAQEGGTILGQLQAEVARFKDMALRSQADFDNFRKRAAREKEDAVKFANANFLERFIPILDNFELGLGVARGSAEGSSIVAGMEMVAKQLQDFLLSQGVEPIVAEGAPFDPNLHEAVAQEASETVPEGVVLRQLRKGFKLRERLLRPSTVVVSKGPAEGSVEA